MLNYFENNVSALVVFWLHPFGRYGKKPKVWNNVAKPGTRSDFYLGFEVGLM